MPIFICPICKRSIEVPRVEDAPYRPFCSHRCKLVDLGRWLDGTYRISEPLAPERLLEASEEIPGEMKNDSPPA